MSKIVHFDTIKNFSKIVSYHFSFRSMLSRSNPVRLYHYFWRKMESHYQTM